MSDVLVRHRFTVDEYEQMGRVGLLDEDDRVELIDGEIVEMSPIGPIHAYLVDQLSRLFIERLGRRAVVRVQNPVDISSRSQLQPDVVVAVPRPGRFRDAHPEAGETLLVVEVADSSLEKDRDVKLPLYAKAQVREVWIIDVGTSSVTAYRDPRGRRYESRGAYGPTDRISIGAFPDVVFDLAELFAED